MAYKEECDDGFAIEFEALSVYDSDVFKSVRQMEISDAITFLDAKSDEVESKIANLNSEIDRLTDNSDNVDYMVAVGCGVLCGLIDSFVVGELNFEEALEKSKEKINAFVVHKSEKLRQRDKIRL